MTTRPRPKLWVLAAGTTVEVERVTAAREPGRHGPGARRQFVLVLVATLVTGGLVAALVAGPSTATVDPAARSVEPASGVGTTPSPDPTPSAAASPQAPAAHRDDAVLTLSAPWPVPQSGLGLGPDEDAVTTLDEPTESPPPDPTPVTGSDGGTRRADSPSTQRQVHTWRDGDVTRRVWVEVEQPPEQESDMALRDAVLPVDGDRKVQEDGADLVFYSESSGAPMTLPGGVLLVLNAEWTEDEVASFFSSNGIAESSVSPLGYLPNGFFVETAPGLPSLNLANALATQAGVLLSSPNWHREVATR